MNAVEIVMHRSLSRDRAALRNLGREQTSANLATLAVSDLRERFKGTRKVEITEFSPSTTESYALKAQVEAPEFAGLLRDDLPEAAEYFEERFRAAIQPFSFTRIDIESIVLDGYRHQWQDLLDVRMDQWISSGKHVLSLSPEEVLTATVKQVGDYAILEDSESSCFVVAKIDENGRAQPVQGGLDTMNEAEETLREHIGATPTMSLRF